MVHLCIICQKILKGNGKKWCKKHYLKQLSKRDQKGINNPAWKGGRTKHTRGYIYIRKPDHPTANKFGYIFEHRLIMENYLGRYLFPTEIVHHINGIKDDNRVENLEIIKQGEHLARHNLLGTHTPERNPITGRWIKKI